MNTNAGEFHCHGKGIFPGVGPIWYNPEGVVNVLSAGLLEMSGKYEITKHRKKGEIYHAVKNKKNGKILRFYLKGGVFIHTVEAELVKNKDNNKSDVKNYSLSSLKTVEGIKNLYTPAEAKRAERASSLIQALVYPSKKDLNAMITAGSIRNCPVTVRDVEIYHHIHGGDKGAIQGKTVRRKSSRVDEHENMTTIPQSSTGRSRSPSASTFSSSKRNHAS